MITATTAYEWECSECGQRTYTSRPPAADEECGRCGVLRRLCVTPGTLLGLRVRVATLACGEMEAKMVAEYHHRYVTVGTPLVFVDDGKSGVAMPCSIEQLGIWTALPNVTPDRLGRWGEPHPVPTR